MFTAAVKLLVCQLRGLKKGKWCVMLEIVILMIGFVTLVRGKMELGRGRELVGWRARVCGAILCSHLAIAFCAGFVIGFLGYTDPILPVIVTVASMIFVVVSAVLVGNLLYKGPLNEPMVAGNS